MIKKIKIFSILFLIVLLIVSGFIIYFKYFERAENGLKYKTYTFFDDEHGEMKIKLEKEGLTFIDYDFQNTFETLALIKVVEEMGVNFNSLTTEEQNDKIDTIVDTLISRAIFKNNKLYVYTYNEQNGEITINSNQFKLTFVYKDEKSKIPFIKEPKITFENMIFK